MSYLPKYATITIYEANLLIENKASRSVWAVLIVINSYAQDGIYSNPSLKKINETMDYQYSIRTIEKAIKFLCDIGIIRRNSRRSKKRFENVIRKEIYLPDKDNWTKENYRQYLTSAHWKNTRKKALKRAGHKCQACSAKDRILDVHHNNYETLGAEEPQDLIVLCRTCHGRIHNK